MLARQRPTAWPLVVCALALVAGLTWWWREAPQPGEQRLAATVAPGAMVRAVPPPVAAPQVQPAVTALAEPSVPEAVSADCLASLTPMVRLRTAAAAASAAGHDDALRPLLARIETEDRRALEAGAALHAAAVERLRASADPVTRAVGLQLAAMPGRTDCLRDDCDAELRAAWQQAQPRLAELAMLALGSHDGEIYARAWAACQRADRMAADVPACIQLSAQRWAQLAPDTAAPWLVLAAQARAAGDSAGELNAMHRAALAPRWQRPAGGLLRALLAQPVPSPSDPIARWHADWHALTADLQGADHPMATLLRFCAAPLDTNRQQVCNQLVGRILAAPQHLLDLTLAILLGQRVGWPAEQLAIHRQARDALTAAEASHARQWIPPDNVDDWQPAALCAGLSAMRQHLLRRADGGELAALRALLPVAPAAASAAPAAAASAQAR